MAICSSILQLLSYQRAASLSDVNFSQTNHSNLGLVQILSNALLGSVQLFCAT